jgi:putative addiction module component (TIGR02574 family)
MCSPVVDLNALRRLSVAERLQIVEDLWDSIAEEAPDEALPITPELGAELDRRLAEHHADPESALSWEEVQRRILARTK